MVLHCTRNSYCYIKLHSHDIANHDLSLRIAYHMIIRRPFPRCSLDPQCSGKPNHCSDFRLSHICSVAHASGSERTVAPSALSPFVVWMLAVKWSEAWLIRLRSRQSCEASFKNHSTSVCVCAIMHAGVCVLQVCCPHGCVLSSTPEFHCCKGQSQDNHEAKLTTNCPLPADCSSQWTWLGSSDCSAAVWCPCWVAH